MVKGVANMQAEMESDALCKHEVSNTESVRSK